MFVIAKHHDLLRQLCLDSLEGVKCFKGELIKDHKGQRDIQRIDTRGAGILPASSAALPPALFLKRNWKPYRKDGLKSLLTRGAVWSASRVEWENSLALRRAGIGVAEPIAFGEECGPLWEKFSFIITAAASGRETIEHFLRTNRDRRERRRVFDALARAIRKMHDAGLASPDLFTRHIFLEPGAAPTFCLIDMARLDHRGRGKPKSELQQRAERRWNSGVALLPAPLRARDLAALHATAPLRFVSTRERLRFLKTYGAGHALRHLIEHRAAHLLRRRKFADFSRVE